MRKVKQVEVEVSDQTLAMLEKGRFAEQAKRAKRNRDNRRARDNAIRSLGLVKVRGALGGIYWE